jgi:hypothetical protein
LFGSIKEQDFTALQEIGIGLKSEKPGYLFKATAIEEFPYDP